MKNGKPVILTIDDDVSLQRLWKIVFQREGIEVIHAFTNDEAWMMFVRQQGRFDAIVFDGHVGRSDIPTLTLVEMVRKLFDGHMIAASSDLALRRQMKTAGCTRQCEKQNLPEVVLELLTSPLAI